MALSSEENEEEKLIQELTSRLKFISKIQPNQIIDLKSFSVMEPCLSTSLYRTCIRMGSENREEVLLFFINTINHSIELATKLNQQDSYHKSIAAMIIESLDKSKMGILNYKRTYAKDIMYCSKLEAFIETFHVKYTNLIKNL
jgi:hypothetical protein